MRDEGSMGIVVIGATLAVMMACLLAITVVTDTLLDYQRARAAADAAALAGVIDGRAAAVAVAAANGATLVEWRVEGDEVTVVVTVDESSATARATDGP